MGEVISWFRIQEMFRFESFHMYGVIGSAIVLGAVFTLWPVACVEDRRRRDLDITVTLPQNGKPT